MSEVRALPIRGAKGGKGGGGSAHVPTEAPDSLRSQQFARVLDLVSEGEIEGLVDGLKSVYLDDTPIQDAATGNFNFTGVSVQTRTGTQAQTAIQGFPAVESEKAVGVEVKNSAPVVRTISNADVTAARVTIAIPQLTFQDPKNGDLRGSSVNIALDVQSNGGGYVTQQTGWTTAVLTAPANATQITANQPSVGIAGKLDVSFTAQTTGSYGGFGVFTCKFRVEYRLVSAPTWTVLAETTVSSRDAVLTLTTATGGWNPWTGQQQGISTYVVSRTFSAPNLANGTYEMRVIKVSGEGTVALKSLTLTVPKYSDTISGKTTSRYQRAYRVPLTGSPPWDIRVRRLTADSTQTNLQNKTVWDAYTEIIEHKLRYPNSALVALSIDSAQFRAIPRRGYEINGLKIRVPANYDPIARTYAGTWDGTFKAVWSNNPAWCFYDMLTSDRYGLGQYIDDAQVDKWALYSIGQYCDQLVPDGFGGFEPRYTCNLYLQTREDAYKVIQDMASIFAAMTYWSAGTITAVQDSPRDPIAPYTPANVIDGAFHYEGTSKAARHTVALITWNDPADGYKQKIEYVEDREGIARYGIVETELIALGVTSRGQAHRLGKMLLYAERNETESVSFRAGLDAVLCYPGAVIETQDPIRAGLRFGGRIVAATVSQVTIDSAVTIETGKTYTLSCVLPDGTIGSSAVTNSAGSATVLTVGTAFAQAPAAQAIWVLAASDLVPEKWRVIGVTEAGDNQYEVSAITYDPNRYAAVEQNLVLEPAQTSILSTAPPDAPGGLNATESLYLISPVLVGNRVTLSWSTAARAWRYQPTWRVSGGNWVSLPQTDALSVNIDGLLSGAHEFRVEAVNALGIAGKAATLLKVLAGKLAPPAAVTGFVVTAISGLASIRWDLHPDLDVQVGGAVLIRYSTKTASATWADGIDIAEYAGGQSSGFAALATGTYMARAEDSSGNLSTGTASFVATEALVTGFTTLATLTEHATFTGAKTNTVVAASKLRLTNAGLFDDVAGLDGLTATLDEFGGIVSSGSYNFAAKMDLATVKTVRLFAALTALSIDIGDLLDARGGTVDDWSDIDGAAVTDTGAQVYVRTTNDDPNVAPTWGPWQPFYVGDYTGRGFDLRLDLATANPSHNIEVSALSVTAKQAA